MQETLSIQITADNKSALAGLKETEGGLVNVSTAYRKQQEQLASLNKTNETAVVSNKAVTVSLNDQKAKLQELRETMRATTDPQLFMQSKMAILGLTEQVKSLEQNTEGLSSTQMAFNRVVRDSHSLLYSTSRGIGELTYAVPNLITKMMEAKTATNSWGMVLGQAATSLFSWPTLLMAGGTALAFWLRGHHGAKEAVDEHKKSLDEFNKSLDQAKAGAMSTGFQLQAFIDIAKNGQFLSERNEALKEANKLMGDHGEKLTLANIATEKITTQTELYTQALINQAVTVKYADRIADLYIKQTEAIADQIKRIKELNDLKAAGVYKNAPAINQSEGIDPNIMSPQWRRAQTLEKEIRDARPALILMQGDILGLNGNLKQTSELTAEAFGKIGTHTKDKTYADRPLMKEAKAKLNPESQVEKIKVKLDIQLENKDELSAIFRETGIKEAEQQLQAYKTALAQLFTIINTPITGNSTERAFQQLEKYKAENLIPTLTFQVQKLQALQEKKLTRGTTSGVGTENEIEQKQRIKDAQDQYNLQLKEASKLADIGTTAFTSLFSAMANGQDIGKTMAKVFEHMLIQITAMIVKAVLLQAILAAITGGTSGAFSAGGGGFTSILKGLFGMKAGGGSVQGGGPYLVGEHGPEIFTPNMTGSITPNSNLNSAGARMGQGSNMNVTVGGRLVGNDIWLSQVRTNFSRDLRT